MKALMEPAGIRLNEKQWEQLWRYHNLLRDRNQDRDLTRIIGFESMVVKHYVDSMIVGKLFPLPSPLLDVGTGAGFPGIPLKIRYPHIKLTLAEPRPRRVQFLKDAIRVCKLDKIDVFDHKVVSQSFTRPVAGVITRAVEEIEKTLLRTSGCISTGGLVIFMKGPNAEPEIREADKRLGRQFKIIFDEAYQLPDSTHDRRLIVYERTDVPLSGGSSRGSESEREALDRED
jgi:16S rRNA (guanine(527)-N(7))-methyltransferase RsmG